MDLAAAFIEVTLASIYHMHKGNPSLMETLCHMVLMTVFCGYEYNKFSSLKKSTKKERGKHRDHDSCLSSLLTDHISSKDDRYLPTNVKHGEREKQTVEPTLPLP